MTELVHDPYDKQKQSAGTFAVFVWVLSGTYLFLMHPTASFLSWQSATYFVVGMFVAAAVFGMVFYALQRSLSKVLSNFIGVPTAAATTAISLLGGLLMIVEAVVIFLAADWTIKWLQA